MKRDSLVRHEPGAVYEIVSDIDLIAPAVRCMLEAVESAVPLDWEARLDIAAALAEALANAILHGNAGDRSRRVTFCAEVETSGDRVFFRIRDEGAGFDPDALPDPTEPERLFAEGGRGVLLMRHYMDEVRFLDGGCEVLLVKAARPR